MLDDLAEKLAVPNIRPDLFWQWAFPVIIIFLHRGQIDVYTRTLACVNLGVETIFAQVNRGTVNLIQQDSGQRPKHLEGKVGTLDYINGRDKAVNDDVCAARVVDAYGISLAVDSYCHVLASRDQD